MIMRRLPFAYTQIRALCSENSAVTEKHCPHCGAELGGFNSESVTTGVHSYPVCHPGGCDNLRIFDNQFNFLYMVLFHEALK